MNDEAQQTTGAGGMSHATPSGEIGGGNIVKTLEGPVDPPTTVPTMNSMAKTRAAMVSPVGRKIAQLVGRPANEWGVIGPGDTIHGYMLLLDLNTGEKVRAADGHKVNEGQLYCNLRCLPESLSKGDALEQFLNSGELP